MNKLGNVITGVITLVVILVCAFYDINGLWAGVVLAVIVGAMKTCSVFTKKYDNRKILNWPKGFTLDELYNVLKRTSFESFNQVTYEAVEGLKEKAIIIRSQKTEEFFVIYKESASQLVIQVLSPAEAAKAGNSMQLSEPCQIALGSYTEKAYESIPNYLENHVVKTKA